jgi:hypothetical protein
MKTTKIEQLLRLTTVAIFCSNTKLPVDRRQENPAQIYRE